MFSFRFVLVFFGLAFAFPTIDPTFEEHTNLKRQLGLPVNSLSLPGSLIPPVPGFTELINNVAPTLPILQIPTPPLPNNPHHSGVSIDGKVLWGGGLLSLLKTQDTGFYFDVSDPYEPKFWKSDRALLASIADEVVAKPDGGYFITYMGSLLGTSPGRLIETDASYNIIHEWPEDIDGTLNILEEQFSPHGLSIDFNRGLMLTSDFVIPLTVLKPSPGGIKRANTLRLWNLASRTIINTITIPNGGGIQDVKFIPGNPEAAAIATAVHLGQVWIIYPYRTDEKGKPGLTRMLYDFGLPDTTAVYSTLSKDGRFAYFLADKHRRDYFVQTNGIGIIDTPADYKVQYIDILPNGGLSIFPQYGGAKPHSSVIFDLSDPWHPRWY
ncbi:hypothetical protein AC579_1739 [Pseudocercospora musae]|uniref:Methanethiol oxidase n=1 Tax=Pseudocercospora musae TaxID=113226 RepID=A0A139IET0_9PEZI|nr:hypothetical protein AC579_1739 [Pseudocercospora musae]